MLVDGNGLWLGDFSYNIGLRVLLVGLELAWIKGYQKVDFKVVYQLLHAGKSSRRQRICFSNA